MRVYAEFKENKELKQELRDRNNQIVRNVARITLDLSYPTIPKDTHLMAEESMNFGVRGGNGEYYIGSPVNYAKRVWNFNDATTNWTTPNTHSKWFSRTLKKNQKIILDNAINQAKKLK